MDALLRSHLATLSRFISDHQAHCELAWHVLCYISVTSYHTRRSVPQYNSNFKRSSSLPLALHTACALVEVFRYHIRALDGPVTPTALDAFICLLHSITSFELAKTLMRGRPKLTRAAYQAFTFLRVGIGITAVVWEDIHLHRAAVKCLNSFLYTRVSIFLLYNLKALDSYADIYALSTYFATVMAMWEGHVPWFLLHVYNAMFLGLVVLNRWVSNQADQLTKNKGATAYPLRIVFVSGMIHLGFAELHTIRTWQGQQSLSQEIEDDYIEATPAAPVEKTVEVPSSPEAAQLQSRQLSSSYTLTRRFSEYSGWNHGMHGHVSPRHRGGLSEIG